MLVFYNLKGECSEPTVQGYLSFVYLFVKYGLWDNMTIHTAPLNLIFKYPSFY